ncbi:MAG: hypothetical protein WD738_13360 [Pirellulales bacterium]
MKITPPSTGNPQPSGKRITPTKYASALESGLQVEVAPGPNDIDLSLVSDSDPTHDSKKSSETSGEETAEQQSLQVEETAP